MTLDYFYGQAGKLFSFYRIPKALFQEQRFQNLSTDAKTLYGILLDRMSLSVKNEWFDKQGRVFIIFTIEDVKRALCCADNKATKLLRELENFGLIERKRRGLGKPSLVYVKNFSSDLSNERVQNRENHESGSPKNACQDPPKSRCNKNKKSKTERNNTNPILSDELEKMKNRKLLEEYFSRSLEVELLLRLYPDDEDTGTYTADYEDFSDTEYLFGGTSIKREAGKDLSIDCALEVTDGTAKVFWISGADEEVTLLETTGTYSDTITLPDGGNYIGIECESFTGSIELNIE